MTARWRLQVIAELEVGTLVRAHERQQEAGLERLRRRARAAR